MRRVIVCGDYSSGKTTFVRNINPETFCGTDVDEVEPETLRKVGKETTVGVEVNFFRGTTFLGMPGQERFSFIWEIFARRFDAILFLQRAENLKSVSRFVDFFSKFEPFESSFKLILITHADLREPNLSHLEGLRIPHITVDPRRRESVLKVAETVVRELEG